MPGIATAVQTVSAAFVAASYILLAQRYPDLPNRIPIHFGFRGRADGWGGKAFLWMCPAFSLAFAVGIIVPLHLGALASAPPVAPYTLLGAQAMMFSLEVGWIRIAAGERSNIWPYVGPFLLILPIISIVASRLPPL
jgi:hypothetical protein